MTSTALIFYMSRDQSSLSRLAPLTTTAILKIRAVVATSTALIFNTAVEINGGCVAHHLVCRLGPTTVTDTTSTRGGVFCKMARLLPRHLSEIPRPAAGRRLGGPVPTARELSVSLIHSHLCCNDWEGRFKGSGLNPTFLRIRL